MCEKTSAGVSRGAKGKTGNETSGGKNPGGEKKTGGKEMGSGGGREKSIRRGIVCGERRPGRKREKENQTAERKTGERDESGEGARARE